MHESLPRPADALGTLIDLSHRARHSASAQELQFMAVNDSHQLAPYRQAALWLQDGGVTALSGVVQIEANAPYVLWLNGVCQQLAATANTPQRCAATDFSAPLADAWHEWLPAQGLWLPLPATSNQALTSGGLLFVRDLPWTDFEIQLLSEWSDSWHHAWKGLHRPARWSWHILRKTWHQAWQNPEGRRWWQIPAARWALGILLVALFPVRLSVLTPGELVPAKPAVLRAPLDGVIDTFHVQPNQEVKKDQPLFGFDEALLKAKLEVTRQALATAETEYRQVAQQALADSRSKAQLSLLNGKIEEKRTEALFVAEQLGRARVLAPQDGIALFDDPSEWIGRPVTVGERIMRIAAPTDIEVEAWVPLADAIPLPEEASLSLYLSASPLSPVVATVRYLAHDAVERPDGSFAYRLRARLDESTNHRVGLKGTVRLNGGYVPLIYWVLRRPIASIRSSIAW